PRRGDGPPSGAALRRPRSGGLPGLGIRHGRGTDRQPAPRGGRPALLHGQRPALPRPVPVRVPLSWLRDYIPFDLAPEKLAERLTLLGFEVKGLEPWGAEWRNVVVGELLTVSRHPRADRLSVTTVTLGD